MLYGRSLQAEEKAEQKVQFLFWEVWLGETGRSGRVLRKHQAGMGREGLSSRRGGSDR